MPSPSAVNHFAARCSRFARAHRIVSLLLAAVFIEFTANSETTQRGGIRLDCWIELSREDWATLVLCCSVTNLRPFEYKYADIGCPPFYVELFDSTGAPIKKSRGSEAAQFFCDWENTGIRCYSGSIAALHSIVVSIPVARAFGFDRLGNAKINVTWAPRQALGEKSPSYGCALFMPANPRVIAAPKSAPKELGKKTIRNGEERVRDTLLSIEQSGSFRPEMFRSVSWTESIWWMCRFPLMLLLAAAVVFLSWRSLRGGKRRACRGIDFMN